MSRRELMKTTGKVAVASALAGLALPQVHAGESNTINIALVGCGNRGTGAAGDALSTTLALADESEKRPNLKVGVGLMCRHCVERKELFDRIKSGEIGDITLLRAYRVRGQEAKEFSRAKPDGMSELLYQNDRFHSFLWASGGCSSD